jgi:hypothetical protein
VTEAEKGGGGSNWTVVSVLERCPSAHCHLCVLLAGKTQHAGVLSPLLLTNCSISRLCSFSKGERSPGPHHSDPGHLEKHLGTGHQAWQHRRVRHHTAYS